MPSFMDRLFGKKLPSQWNQKVRQAPLSLSLSLSLALALALSVCVKRVKRSIVVGRHCILPESNIY